MIAPRRFLPSIPSLLALEAVDRLGSVTEAAAELALTHSAVSRQLRTLQEQIGVDLIHRHGKGVRLTASARDYAQAIRSCLNDLAQASLKLRAGGACQSLTVGVLPDYGVVELSGLLQQMARLYPQISLTIARDPAGHDLGDMGIDAAITLGPRASFAGLPHLILGAQRLLPCAHPDLCPPFDAAALRAKPLLHLTQYPDAWERWFSAHGLPSDQLRGMLFDDYATLIEAARLGLGLALLPETLARAEVSGRKLVQAWGEYWESGADYGLVWRAEGASHGPLAQFLGLLRGQSAP